MLSIEYHTSAEAYFIFKYNDGNARFKTTYAKLKSHIKKLVHSVNISV